MNKKALKIIVGLAAVMLLILNGVAFLQARTLVNNPLAERTPQNKTPADVGLAYQDVNVTSSDGLTLQGWYMPSANNALIIMQHGYKWNRVGHLEEAEMFVKAGYGVLISTVRAHDVNPGEKITFGAQEMKDLSAWAQLASSLPGIDPQKVGMLGDSLGGSMVIQYAAMDENISAVVAHSAFSSLRDTIETSIKYYTGLPPFPFAPLIQFWAELDLGISIDEINATNWISEISPRPILIIHSLDDQVISAESGELLYNAALEPKQLWLESDVKHADFDIAYPAEFQRKVVGFFNQYFFPNLPSNIEIDDATSGQN